MGEEDIHIFAWDLKRYIKSVILDWRQRSTGCSSEVGKSASLTSEGERSTVLPNEGERFAGRSSEGERSAGRSSEGERSTGRSSEETRCSLKQTCHMRCPAVALIYTKGPRHRRKICVNSLWLYSYFTHVTVEE